jgi:hypothetical protein
LSCPTAPPLRSENVVALCLQMATYLTDSARQAALQETQAISSPAQSVFDRYWDALGIAQLADITSLISFGLTIAVFLSVRHIKRTYLFRARVPNLIARVGQHASAVATLLNAYHSSTHEITLELTQTEVSLNSLRKKMPSRAATSIKPLLKQIKAYSRSGDEAGLRQIYIALRKIEAELNEAIQDLQWTQ